MEPRQLERSDVIGTDHLLIIPCLVNGIPVEGDCVVYRDDGSLLLEITYLEGLPNGSFRDYWVGGQLASEGQFVNGVIDGLWRYLRLDGTTEERRFINGREIVPFFQTGGKSCE